MIDAVRQWLTSTHAVALPGWLWLAAVPAAVLALIVVGWVAFYVCLVATFRSRW